MKWTNKTILRINLKSKNHNNLVILEKWSNVNDKFQRLSLQKRIFGQRAINGMMKQDSILGLFYELLQW